MMIFVPTVHSVSPIRVKSSSTFTLCCGHGNVSVYIVVSVRKRNNDGLD
jgi:hypothetical protein